MGFGLFFRVPVCRKMMDRKKKSTGIRGLATKNLPHTPAFADCSQYAEYGFPVRSLPLSLGGDSVYVNNTPPFWSIISSVALSILAFLKLHP